MSKNNLCSWVLVTALSLLAFSCKDEKDEPVVPRNVAENLVGKWLLASSDAENWICYEFTETSRINVEMTEGGYYHSGEGWYSVNEENAAVSGSYETERKETVYIDWIVEKTQAFQIDFKLYDNNTYLGAYSIYRVMSAEEVQAGVASTPDYRALCGTRDVSNFTVLDPNIVSVNNSGEITGVSTGTTFITFSTPNGKAALRIEVIAKAKTFAERIIGSWVLDTPGDWEVFTFEENGFVSVSWKASSGGIQVSESAQSTYSIDNENVLFTVSIPSGQMNMRFETEDINDFTWTYRVYDGSYMNGKYTVQRILESIVMEPGGIHTPDYQPLISGYEIIGYASHNTSIATVDAVTGAITAVSRGRTYIDVQTAKGAGVIEVSIEGGAIPYEFQDCIGRTPSKLKEMLGTPYYEDGTAILYKQLTDTIDMVGASIDSFSGLVKGITVIYNSNVETDAVTSILDVAFIPYTSQTTATYKAYMDAAERTDASIGVTWDIPTRTLTYVNLAKELFTDYSILIGMNRSQVIDKMGREPNLSDDRSQSYFFFDNKGIMIVSAYYTDFVNKYDNVRSVVTMFDDTLTVEQITDYLKKKYPYYPEYSADEELVFVPEGHAMEIYYMPKDSMIMYVSTAGITNASAKTMVKAAVADKLKAKMQTLKR